MVGSDGVELSMEDMWHNREQSGVRGHLKWKGQYIKG